MAYFFTLIPFLLMIIILLMMDCFSLVKWGRLCLCIGWGIISGAICLLIYQLKTPTDISEMYITPILEEFIKGLLLIYLFSKKKTFFLIDSIVYGVAIGGGFGLIENIFYIIANQDAEINHILFTTLSTATIHIGSTALLAAMMHSVMTSGKNTTAFYFLTLFIPIALHILYNMIDFPPHIILIISLFTMTLILAIVVTIDKKRISDWVESSMSSQIELLEAIKRNKLAANNVSGTYIQHFTKDFKPDRAGMIVNYVTLFLELSIAAKGNMLAMEGGVTISKDPKNQDKIQELYSLRKKIGKTGVLSIDEVIHFDNVEKRIINSLI